MDAWPLGKRRRLALLADWDGRLQVLGADQAGAAEAALLSRCLSGHASAICLAPTSGFDVAWLAADRGTALLVALADPAAETPRLRESTVVHDALRAGAAGGLLRLAWPAEEAARAAVTEFVSQVGDECAKHELPLLVEPTFAPLAAAATADQVASRADAVVAAATALAATDCQADLLVLPLPGSLVHTHEYAAGACDGVARPALQPLAELRAALTRLTAATTRPWVLRLEDPWPAALVAAELAAAQGACGYWCAGTTWSGWTADGEDPGAWLLDEAAARWRRLVAAGDRAQPWFAPRGAAVD